MEKSPPPISKTAQTIARFFLGSFAFLILATVGTCVYIGSQPPHCDTSAEIWKNERGRIEENLEILTRSLTAGTLYLNARDLSQQAFMHTCKSNACTAYRMFIRETMEATKKGMFGVTPEGIADARDSKQYLISEIARTNQLCLEGKSGGR